MGEKVYLVPATLEGWKSKMATINKEAEDVIRQYRNETNQIDNYLRGKFSSSYVEMVNSLMDEAESSHEAMKDIEVILQNVVNKAESE
jgi:conjugal transfer/entry exclusion protein